MTWLTGHLGRGLTSTRIPSLVLGTATVPLVYCVGLRLAGRWQGVLGAGLVALSPFAVFYGVENRPYAAGACFVVTSTLLLLVALEPGRRRWWWVAYAVAVAAAAYTHYTTVFPLAAQTIWAAWTRRDRLLELALATAGAAVAFVPWLGGFAHQLEGSGGEARQIEAASPVTVHNLISTEVRSLVGHLALPLSNMPGRLILGLLVSCVLLAGATAAVRAFRDGVRGWRPSAGLVLLLLLALAAPVGAALYGIRPSTSLLLPRNLYASAPFAALLTGAVIVAARRPVAPACAGVALAALLVASLVLLDDHHRRPSYSDAAAYIRARLRPGDTVVNLSLGYDAGALQVYLAPVPVIDALDKRRAFAETRPGGSLWAVAALGVVQIPPAAGPRLEFRRASSVTIPGWSSLIVVRYVRARR